MSPCRSTQFRPRGGSGIRARVGGSEHPQALGADPVDLRPPELQVERFGRSGRPGLCGAPLQDPVRGTLDEIGQVYGVTRERIRQIESKTMSKLRHPSRYQVLRDYLD